MQELAYSQPQYLTLKLAINRKQDDLDQLKTNY